MNKMYIVKSSRGQWDSWMPLTIAVCTSEARAEGIKTEWLAKVAAWENKYSEADQIRLNKEWSTIDQGIPYTECPKHLVEYDSWVNDQQEYEKYSKEVKIEEVLLDTILIEI